LDVERRRVDHEVAPVLLVLAAPEELRVEVAVAPLVGDAYRVLRLLLQHRLVLRGRDIPARRLSVAESIDGLGGRWLRLAGHGVYAQASFRSMATAARRLSRVHRRAGAARAAEASRCTSTNPMPRPISARRSRKSSASACVAVGTDG